MKGRYGWHQPSSKFILFLSLSFIIVASVFLTFSVRADDYEGGETGGTTTSCDFPQMFTELCGTEGGASWHIYETDSGSSGPADGSSYSCGEDPCVVNSDSLSTIKSNCAGSGYYVAYGWDGRTNGRGSAYQHIGPTQWNTGVIAGATYNSNGGLSYDDIIAGNFSNGSKLDEGVAEQLHDDMGDGSTIDDTVGYFCVAPGDKFEARATSTEVADDHSSVTSGYTDQIVKGSDNKLEDIPCSNAGCDATFTFDIKRTTRGSDKASWTIQKRSATKINGEWEWYYTPYGGTDPGGTGVKEKTVKSFTDTLAPGTTTCYRIAFTPSSTSDDIKTVATCVETLPVTFEGYSKVSLNGSSTSVTTGWKNSGNLSNNTAWLELTGCNDGCNITFEHGIKRTQGLSTSTSNYNVASIGADSGTFPTKSPTSHTVTIKTGQAYCRTLTFDRKIAYSNTSGSIATTTTSTRACAYAIGTYGSTIDIKAKKSTGSTWLEAIATNPIYAKPTDVINLRGTYSPKYQPTYNFKPYIVKIGSTSTTNSSNNTIQNIFNRNVNPSWNNAFSIKLNGNYAAFSELAETNSIGDDSSYHSNRDYTISPLDPGNTITATALTNNIEAAKTTPKQVGFTYTIGNGFTATVNNDSISDHAYIKVPYNFDNHTCIQSKVASENDANGCIKPSVERIAYAGETETINYQIDVDQRYNSVVGDTYATIVKDAKWKLRICINENENCLETSEQSGTLNPNGLLTGDTSHEHTTVNIPDVNAGTRVCVYSAVYPASVNGDTDLSSTGNDTWRYSAPSCYKIAKKPSLQILGGNIYSSGEIHTSVSDKRHLSGVNDPYGPETTYDHHVFGSWGELGIIANDTVTGISSGADLSYPHGSSQVSICNRSPLTFANTPCSTSQKVGSLGNSVAAKSIKDDDAALSSRYLYGGDPTVTESTVDLSNEDDKMKDDSVYYYYNTDDLTIPTSTINRSRIKVVHSTKNITITGNIQYGDNLYTSFNDLPKLLVYAKNIIIDCSVSRIDAILVAQDKVVTCNNFDGNITSGAFSKSIADHLNDKANSHPLTINGAVISSQLIANRTYGAATGTNSGVPAETINFDPTLYKWGGDRFEGSAANTSLVVTYQHEQAPRY